MDNIICLNKVDISKQQIERAILLFNNENDYISALTLSGAADEVLGTILKNKGLSSSYSGISSLMNQVHEQTQKQPYTSKEFNEIANGPRNHIKHYSNTEMVEFDPKQEACNMIYRAICNYKSLESTGTEKMDAWLKSSCAKPAFKLR